MKIYSAWGKKGGILANTLVEGEKPLCFPDGKIDEDCEEKFYTFGAHSYEEAMSIYYLRQGWSPYVPEGDAAPCPNCGMMYYPDGSRECWSCSNKV